MRLENLILRNLINNNEFCKRALPFIKEDYFSVREDQLIFTLIRKFIAKYRILPTIDSLLVEANAASGLKEAELKRINEDLESYREKFEEDQKNLDWMLDTTEEWCQDKAIFNAMTESIEIANGEDSKKDKGAIPKLLSDALAVSFDNTVGHDYLMDGEARYDFMHRVEEKMEFDLTYFNYITRNGVSRKTLNVILAGTGIGKTLMKCHLAAMYLLQGLNVLYITLEMSEEKIAERIDANLMDLEINDVNSLPKDLYVNKVQRLKSKTSGQLIVKEYPTSQANVMHFQSLLNDLRIKKNFVPDVIFIDYINICSSARFKPGMANSYELVKAIAEELRGLAVEGNVVMWTSTQTNRAGFTSSDVGLADTAESFGLPATADFMFTVMSNENLEREGIYLIKQLKNRYSEITERNRRFYIGVNKAKMKLYDAEKEAFDDLPTTAIPQMAEDAIKRFARMKS